MDVIAIGIERSALPGPLPDTVGPDHDVPVIESVCSPRCDQGLPETVAGIVDAELTEIDVLAGRVQRHAMAIRSHVPDQRLLNPDAGRRGQCYERERP